MTWEVIRAMLVPIIFILVLDFYSYRAVKAAFRDRGKRTRNIARLIHFSLTLFFIGLILFVFLMADDANIKQLRRYVFPLFALNIISKLIAVFFIFLEDLRRIFGWLWNKAKPKNDYNPERSKFMSKLALLLGTIPVLGLLYGTRNVYNYQTRRVKLPLKNLPASFEGYKIVQISDIHIGSLTDKERFLEGFKMINAEKPDAVFFTGDLVNNVSTELEGWEEVLSTLRAKDGVFSILGNHDYGDYYRWNNKDEKKANLQLLKDYHNGFGWQLLLDEHKYIERPDGKLAIIGVENWGAARHFPKYGNLDTACQGCEADVKLLLSHDPSHWDAQVRPNQPDIDCTFSGHTHGFQLGFEIRDFRWSPSKLIYKQWAGLYQKGEQYLYVNRGYGVLGYPGRIGIMPEITVFELEGII